MLDASGVSPCGREVMRMEQLFGIADHGIDLGPYGLGTERSLEEYEAWSGVSFANRTFRIFSHMGPFEKDHKPEDMELFGLSDGDRYGLGIVRTLREFEEFSGVRAVHVPRGGIRRLYIIAENRGVGKDWAQARAVLSYPRQASVLGPVGKTDGARGRIRPVLTPRFLLA